MKRLFCKVLCLLLCFSQVLCFSTVTQGQLVVTALAKEESGSNSLGFIIGDYDVKEKEKEKKDSYQSYDKTGPKLENATVVNVSGTSESIKETVNNDSVNSNGGKYIITIDPGHSKVSTGSAGNGIKEEEYTLEIGKLLYNMMKNDSRFEVHLTRSSPAGVANSKRPQISLTLIAFLVYILIFGKVHPHMVQKPKLINLEKERLVWEWAIPSMQKLYKSTCNVLQVLQIEV